MNEPKSAQAGFTEMYRSVAPWDVDHPQREFVQRLGQITGDVLDAGCGTGEHSLWLARAGRRVLGIDFTEVAIERARQKQAARGLDATFQVHDVTRLDQLTFATTDDGQVDCVIDSGLFHCLDDPGRAAYVSGLAQVVRPGGHVFLMCFSELEPGSDGPRRVSQPELEQAFADGWKFDSIDPARFEIIPDLTGFEFSPGGPKSYFCTIRRQPQAGDA